MARLTVRALGCVLTLEARPGLRTALRRRLGRDLGGSVVPSTFGVVAPPPLRLERRDPVAAVAPWRLLADARTPAGEDAPLEEQVRSRSWYHTIELPGGILTPGEFDHRPLVTHYGLPSDLSGQRALDIAGYDGFWAFELERRGATVTSVDVGQVGAYDFPPAARHQLESEHLDRPHVTGFEVARRALGSRVERLVSNVYDLNPADHGIHDFVHVADLLLHLESPIRALRAIRSVTGRTAHIVDAYDPALSTKDGSQTVTYLGGWDIVVWWLPSMSALAQMVLDAGFTSVRLHTTYHLGRADGGAGLYRAVLIAEV